MSLEQRKTIIDMIDQARSAGARLNPACQCTEIDAATYRRCQLGGQVFSDRRATALRPVPGNKLAIEEQEIILLTGHLPRKSGVKNTATMLTNTGSH